jgi:hypothetical protein
VTPTVSVAAYLLTDAPDYLQPTVRADRGWLHLEGRYNYEDRQTGTLFIGWNHELGEELRLTFTPMVGGVLGRTRGVAPGLVLGLAWGPLELHSESEYVIDLDDASDSFFYSWSEASARLGSHLRAGLVAQRTKIVRTPRELAVGPWLGASLGKLDAAIYLFDPLDEGRFWVVSVGVTF